MSIPPSFSTGIPNQLMTEEEIRQYFMRNGGVVKNTDIVNYFRTYLSNPAIKDEARIIFKTYVNKLASVKVENGEKFLVLKRQYFPPIDGNGNSGSSGLPPINAYTPTQQQYTNQQQTPSSSAYGQPNHYGSQSQLGLPLPPAHNQRLSISSTSSQFPNLQMNSNSYPSGSGPPPYGYPPAVNPAANANNLRRQNSQSQIYGSHFSLNSNYADPYSYSINNNNLPSSQQQYYQQQMSGLGHGHGGSTFSLASQYTTASSAGVPPYHQQQHQNQPQQPSLHHHQQQVPMQNTHYHHNVQPQPQLHRSLSQTQPQSYGMPQPVSQMQQYSQHQQQQQGLAKNNNFGGYSTAAGQLVDYPPEFGLPPASASVNFGSPQSQQQQHQLSSSSSSTTSPHHRHLSPQSSGGSGSTSSLQRAPPPYRPPPPAANQSVVGLPSLPVGPPPLRSNNHSSRHHQQMRRSSVSSASMSGSGSGSNIRYHRSPSNPGSATNYMTGSTQNVSTSNMDSYNGQAPAAAFQYQRSISASGPPGGSLQGLPAVSPPQHSEPQQQQQHPGYPSDASVNPLVPGAPTPPVPPRHKRGVERSPSAISGTSNASSSANFRNLQSSSTGGGFGGSRHRNRRNMEMMNGDGSAVGGGMNGGMENDHEKENINQLVNGTNGSLEESSSDSQNDNNIMQNGDSETEQKISVRERMQKFNRIASESELAANKMSSKSKREISSKHESVDFDTASLSSLEPRAKEWMLKSAQCDYHVLNKLAQENPSLVRRRDMNYTCLHWAAKKGHVELVKLFAGSYQADVNAKSNGGYTPLHLAAQFSRQEVYDILVKAYNADVNIRDHSGKKPMQYLVRQDTSVSMDTFKKIKEKRRSTEMQRDRDSSFLRIGSLNVKVKSTREAFGYLLGGKSTATHSSTSIERAGHKNWGSVDNIQEVEVNGEKDKDKNMMPPPPPTSLPHNSGRKKKTRRVNGGSPTIKENVSDSDSDSAFGFGSDWNSP